MINIEIDYEDDDYHLDTEYLSKGFTPQELFKKITPWGLAEEKKLHKGWDRKKMSESYDNPKIRNLSDADNGKLHEILHNIHYDTSIPIQWGTLKHKMGDDKDRWVINVKSGFVIYQDGNKLMNDLKNLSDFGFNVSQVDSTELKNRIWGKKMNEGWGKKKIGESYVDSGNIKRMFKFILLDKYGHQIGEIPPIKPYYEDTETSIPDVRSSPEFKEYIAKNNIDPKEIKRIKPILGYYNTEHKEPLELELIPYDRDQDALYDNKTDTYFDWEGNKLSPPYGDEDELEDDYPEYEYY